MKTQRMTRSPQPMERWYDYLPTANELARRQEYARWIQPVPWQLYVTLTFAYRVSRETAVSTFGEWINRLEREFHCPISWVRGDEKRNSPSGLGMSPTALHFHALLTAAVHLDRERAEHGWHKFGHIRDNALALDYDPARGKKATNYCLKFLNDTEGDWAFGNLDLCLPGQATHPGADARRRLRRHQELCRHSLAGKADPATTACMSAFEDSDRGTSPNLPTVSGKLS